jgi:uracil-DNA glycosylase
MSITDPAGTAPQFGTWEALTNPICRCIGCPQLVAGRTSVVPGVAPAGADVLFVGEAPGVQEDATGIPFVGRAGQLLDSLLTEVGLPRDRVAVTNVIKCRPPGNRKPRRSEIAQCTPWLARQVEVLDPVLIVTLGGTAAEWALGPATKIGVIRGTLQRYRPGGGSGPAGAGEAIGRREWPLLCTYHPSAAIRFGPQGAPMSALREDLARAAELAAQLRAASAASPSPGS